MKTFMVILLSSVVGFAVLGACFVAEKEANMTPAQRAAEARERSPEAIYQRMLERRAADLRREQQERNDLAWLMYRQNLQRRQAQ